jgi:hypothetical protein
MFRDWQLSVIAWPLVCEADGLAGNPWWMYLGCP